MDSSDSSNYYGTHIATTWEEIASIFDDEFTIDPNLWKNILAYIKLDIRVVCGFTNLLVFKY